MKNHSSQFMSHVVVGYPSFEHTRVVVDALVEGGSSSIELQMPFSDPLADGPAIMHASTISLQHGCTVDSYFTFCKEVAKAHPNIRCISVIYASTICSRGIDVYIRELCAAGMYGIIVPDLPVDTPECDSLIRACTIHSCAYIPVVSHTTPQERLHLYAAHTPQIIYTTRYLGVTGSSGKADANTAAHVARLRDIFPHTRIAVGFGISTPEDVAQVSEYADIVVIGSAFIHIIRNHEHDTAALYKNILHHTRACVAALHK